MKNVCSGVVTAGEIPVLDAGKQILVRNFVVHLSRTTALRLYQQFCISFQDIQNETLRTRQVGTIILCLSVTQTRQVRPALISFPCILDGGSLCTGSFKPNMQMWQSIQGLLEAGPKTTILALHKRTARLDARHKSRRLHSEQMWEAGWQGSCMTRRPRPLVQVASHCPILLGWWWYWW